MNNQDHEIDGKSKKKYRTMISVVLAVLLILFDQFTKRMTVLHLKGQDAFVLIDGVLELDYLENRGVAFGMFQNQRWPILIMGFILMAVIIWFICKLPEGRKYTILQYILVFIAAGGIGNMIDRFFLGYVVDMISFVLINYPVFNVADCYVVCGTIALFVMFLFVMKDEDFEFLAFKKNKEKTTKAED